jgi:hypothetical protein
MTPKAFVDALQRMTCLQEVGLGEVRFGVDQERRYEY